MMHHARMATPVMLRCVCTESWTAHATTDIGDADLNVCIMCVSVGNGPQQTGGGSLQI